MKDTLSEIKKIKRKSTMEWMKPTIKSMIWNTRRKHSIRIPRRKKNKKKKRG